MEFRAPVQREEDQSKHARRLFTGHADSASDIIYVVSVAAILYLLTEGVRHRVDEYSLTVRLIKALEGERTLQLLVTQHLF